MTESSLLGRDSAATADPEHRTLEGDALSAWLGVRVVKAEPGDIELQMDLRPEMLNGFGIAHGGVLFAFADSAFALACNHPTDDDGTITVAQGADVNFLRAAHVGQTLTAYGREVSAGRSGVYDIEVVAQGPDDESPVRIVIFRGRSRTIARR